MLSMIITVIGFFLILLGFVIWKFKAVDIVAGYNENKTSDKKGLAKWVGSNLVIMGSVNVILGLVTIFIGMTFLYIFLISFGSILLFSIRAALGCKQFEK